jgi:hypothetical protein
MPGVITGKHMLWDVVLKIGTVDLSNHVESVEFTVGINSQAAAAMGEIQDYSMGGTLTITDPKVTFYQDFAAASVYATLQTAWAARTVFDLIGQAASGVSSPTNPKWTIPCFVGEAPVISGTRGDRHMTSITFAVAGAYTVNTSGTVE